MPSKTQYVASISYGKDSLAMLEVIKNNALPLDRIVHVELMATPTVPADLPEVMDWKHYADEIIATRYGIQVEKIKAPTSYVEEFYKIPTRSEKNAHLQGTILGFPSLRSQWCSQLLKVRVMKAFFAQEDTVQYIGIAADEPKRFNQLTPLVRSPLVEFGVTEPMAYEICEHIGLLAPTYLQSKRSGCWFCHAQPIKQLRLLRQQHPDLWQMLLGWDKDSSIPFRHGVRHGDRSVADFDDRFALEDMGLLEPDDPRFKWAEFYRLRDEHLEKN